MKTICITAAYSKLGKTALAEHLIPHLRGWGVCKVTACIRHEEENCPRGQEDTCGICNSLQEKYEIETADEVVRKKGTDTGRYADAGADRIVWVKSRPEYIDEALKKAMKELNGCQGIIFEGNHVLDHHTPDLAVMIVSKTGKYKDSASAVKEKIDLFLNPGNYEKAVRTILDRI
jgi:molybdopterin-guanine dinucleotide biosynthesis protein